MNMIVKFSLISVLLLSISSFEVSAQELLSKNGSWVAYTIKESSGKVCYMFTRPIKEEGNYTQRSEAYAMVTRRQGTKTSEEVSVTSGYPYKGKSITKVTIDGRSHSFSVLQGEYAWSEDPKYDPKIIKAMARGNKLTVRGTSKKGTKSKDTYSLKGFTATHKVIVKACP